MHSTGTHMGVDHLSNLAPLFHPMKVMHTYPKLFPDMLFSHGSVRACCLGARSAIKDWAA